MTSRSDARFDTPAEERAFLIHYAKVLLAEAQRRRGPFAASLLEWAGKARRRAFELGRAKPKQGELF